MGLLLGLWVLEPGVEGEEVLVEAVVVLFGVDTDLFAFPIVASGAGLKEESARKPDLDF
jgi:hypothetical protein